MTKSSGLTGGVSASYISALICSPFVYPDVVIFKNTFSSSPEIDIS